MPVGIIKIIGRKIFNSFYSLMLFTMSIYFVFITSVSVYTTLHTTHNKKDTNRKDDNDNIWEYCTMDDIKIEIPLISRDINEPDVLFFHVSHPSILIIASITILVLCYFLCRCSIKCYLKSLYNRLCRRNQAKQNEPVRHQAYGMYWRAEELNIPSFKCSSDESESLH